MKRTIPLAGIFTFGLAVLLILPLYAGAQQFETAPDEIKNKYDERGKRIKQELEGLRGNVWAGDYWAQQDPEVGSLFRWSPSGGFTVRYGNEFERGVEKVNYGGANFDGNLLTLSPEYLEKNKHNYAVSGSFVPVRWGTQHWLIPSDQLIHFIYAVNSGDYDEISSFFVKYVDIKKSNKGLPDVPKEYRKYLNRKPVKTKVIGVKGNNSSYFTPTLTLDAGKDKDVVKDMKFYSVGIKDALVRITVTDVWDHTSTARIISIGTSGESDREINPEVGWEFTGKMP